MPVMSEIEPICPRCGEDALYYVQTCTEYHSIGTIYTNGVNLGELEDSYPDGDSYFACGECGSKCVVEAGKLVEAGYEMDDSEDGAPMTSILSIGLVLHADHGTPADYPPAEKGIEHSESTEGTVAKARAEALDSALLLKHSVEDLIESLKTGDAVGGAAASLALNAGNVIGYLGRVAEAESES